MLSQGYQVYSGRIKDNEITFVAIKNDIFTCIQIAYSLADDGAYRRAISGLRQLSSKYKKLLITVKPALNYAGLDPDIEIIDLYSWLTN